MTATMLPHVNIFLLNADGSKKLIWTRYSRSTLYDTSNTAVAYLDPYAEEFTIPHNAAPFVSLQRLLSFMAFPTTQDGIMQVKIRDSDDFGSAIELHQAILFLDLKEPLNRHPLLRNYLLQFLKTALPKEAVAKVYLEFWNRDRGIVELMATSFVIRAEEKVAVGDSAYWYECVEYFEVYAPGLRDLVGSIMASRNTKSTKLQVNGHVNGALMFNQVPIPAPKLVVSKYNTALTATNSTVAPSLTTSKPTAEAVVNNIVPPAPQLAFPVKAVIEPRKPGPRKAIRRIH